MRHMWKIVFAMMLVCTGLGAQEKSAEKQLIEGYGCLSL